MRELSLIFLIFVSGCAGAFGAYGPGMNGLSRSGSGASADGNSRGYSYSYTSGETGLGAQIGARVGYMTAKVGSVRSGGGLAVDVHADFTVSRGRFGAALTGGYTSDRIIGGDTWFFSGFPVGAYGQFLLTPRLILHAGGSYIVSGAVKHIEQDKSGDVTASRGFGGLGVVLSRTPSNDWMFRVEGRYTKSGAGNVAGTPVAWSSTAVLGEIVWATF